MRQTWLEALENLTGYDEDAIKERFGLTSQDLVGDTPLLDSSRALIFSIHRHDGLSDDDAYHAAKALTLKQVGDYFTEEPVREDGTENPVITPAGNDSALPA